jgi:hypothetical protein
MPETVLLAAARRRLEDVVKMPVEEEKPERYDRHRIDALFRLGGKHIVVEVKSNARGETVSKAVAQLREYQSALYRDAHLLLVVPHMGDVGADICAREGVNWIDLRGNATIEMPMIRVYIRGRRDPLQIAPYSEPDSGVNPFSRKASRITHALLTAPEKPWRRSELEEIALLDKGYVSKIVSELIAHEYLKEQPKRARNAQLHVVNPLVLLDAWRENYKRERPVAWALIAARTGAETVQRFAGECARAEVGFAITGLGAAASYTDFGSFRRVDVYIEHPLPDDTVHRLNVGADERGRNVAIYVDPASTRIGVERRGDVHYASPVLTYLDLAHLPERSIEAADEMRRYLEQQWK